MYAVIPVTVFGSNLSIQVNPRCCKCEVTSYYLNYKNYYPDDNQNAPNHTSKALTYERILNECGLDPYATYDKNTDNVKLLEAAYTILHTLLGNIDMYRKIETEFATQGEAFTNLTNRLKDLRAEINKIKAEMHYQDSDFSFMYYTR